MTPLFFNNITSVTDLQKNTFAFIKEITETLQPKIIFNHNKPQAVIVDWQTYQKISSIISEIKETALFKKLWNERKNEKTISLQTLQKKAKLKHV